MTLIEFGHDLFRVVFFLWRRVGLIAPL